jgi:glycosyltransferase involved in cell wall biosynthesis
LKLIIQIPCFNEEKSLPLALAALPREVPGFETVEWLVVDDGSTDGTSAVAKAHGVDHVVRHIRNQGLARAFMTGISACLREGADVILNTDADNQYDASYIPQLTEPIIKRKADLVVGARPIDNIAHFSFLKKKLQRLGSWVVRVVSGTDIPDAPSGFRAFSKTMASHLMVYNDYTYTLETIIQAGQLNMAIASVPIQTNGELRPSRLVKSIPNYIRQSIITLFRIFLIYRPFKFLSSIASAFLVLGTVLGLRFLYYYLQSGDENAGHIQSLILAAVLLLFGFGTLLLALIAEVLAANRKLAEDIRYRLSSHGF